MNYEHISCVIDRGKSNAHFGKAILQKLPVVGRKPLIALWRVNRDNAICRVHRMQQRETGN